MEMKLELAVVLFALLVGSQGALLQSFDAAGCVGAGLKALYLTPGVCTADGKLYYYLSCTTSAWTLCNL